MGTAYTSADYTYDGNGKVASATYSGFTGQPYTSYTVVYGPNGKPASVTYSNGATSTWTYNSDGSLHELVSTGIVGTAYTSADYTYDGNGKVASATYSGFTGQPYTSYTVVYGPNGKPASVTYSNGATSTWTYNSDGSYTVVIVNSHGTYTTNYSADGKPTGPSTVVKASAAHAFLLTGLAIPARRRDGGGKSKRARDVLIFDLAADEFEGVDLDDGNCPSFDCDELDAGRPDLVFLEAAE